MSDDRERLTAAWRAMLERAVGQGYPEVVSAETMLEVALSRLVDCASPQQAAEYLESVHSRLRDRATARLLELKIPTLGTPEDEAFRWPGS